MPAAIAVALCLGAAALLLSASAGTSGQPGDARRILITIPPGTASNVARGQPARSVPTHISARVGDTLLLVNDDTADHMLGPFYISSHQTVSVPLQRAGTYRGTCVLQPNHHFTIVVR